MAEAGAILRLAAASLADRRATALLTVCSIAVSVALLLGVERVRTEARSSFANTISGTDLVIGARSGPLQLLLYTVFRIGSPTNNVSWASFEEIAASPLVRWAIPISLGDSHRGYRVLATTGSYFDHYRYGARRSLVLAEGARFDDTLEAVVGAEVAASLGYAVGTQIVISHGIGKTSFADHDEHGFSIVGVLERTGTPVDRTVHVQLSAIEVIHEEPSPAAAAGPAGLPSFAGSDRQEEGEDHSPPESITAFLLALEDRTNLLRLQRAINEYPREPLLAIVPGVALQELWGIVGIVERALLAVSACVIIAGLLGLLVAILTSLNERRREMAILRSVGARPAHVFVLLLSEAGLIAGTGAVLGVVCQAILVAVAGTAIEDRLGIHVAARWPGGFEAAVVGIVIAAGVLLALWPAWRAYRNTLADGLTVRV